MFAKYDKSGKVIRRKVGLDCSGDPIITEQCHKAECDINQIIKKHGMDMIAKTALLRSAEYQFDDVTGNDFQEAMFKVAKAQETFDSLPSKIRKEFNNSPAAFLDFVQNPENQEKMIALGLATKVPETQPIKVEVTNVQTTTTSEGDTVP